MGNGKLCRVFKSSSRVHIYLQLKVQNIMTNPFDMKSVAKIFTGALTKERRLQAYFTNSF